MTESAPTMRAYGRQLFICTGGTCAATATAAALAAGVPDLLGDRRKLRNPERIKCTTTDCLGVCAAGPIAVVYPDGIWYHHVDQALLARIVREHLIDGQPVEHAIFHRLYPAGQEPGYAPALRGDDGQFTAAPANEPQPSTPAIAASDTALHSTPEKQQRRREVQKSNLRKGLVIVNTGNGKG